MSWHDARIADDGTHHLVGSVPLYDSRYHKVGKFHEPGLAPAQDGSGALHINPGGLPAYARRYAKTFGFYEGRAAAEAGDGWTHLNTDGSPLSDRRWLWCGNFQESRATVCDEAGYIHVDPSGEPISDARWAYAGDFREYVAVVQDREGLHLHVDHSGQPLNSVRFLDLDTFHKGFARARDGKGWHHVDRHGRAAYPRRFAAVEPFYNGRARVEDFNGALLVIDETGREQRVLRPALKSELTQLSSDMVGFWRTQSIGAAVELGIFETLPASIETICAECGLRPDRTHRLLQALGELTLVQQFEGVWSMTSRGALLRRDHDLTMADAAVQWSHGYVDAWAALPSVLRLESDWRPPAHFESLSTRPEEVVAYHRKMASYARHDYASLPDVIDGQRHERLLDAAGGTGALLELVLRRWPKLRGVLLDRPEVLAHVPAGLRTNVELRPGDVFDAWGEPVDAVVLARVLHDWDDADAERILRRAREAMHPGGQVYVVDLLTQPGSFKGGLLSLHMMLATGGRERGLDEFKRLFKATGFRFIEVRRLPAVSSVIVAEAI